MGPKLIIPKSACYTGFEQPCKLEVYVNGQARLHCSLSDNVSNEELHQALKELVDELDRRKLERTRVK